MHLNLAVFPEAKARVEQEEELWGQHKRHAQKQEGEKDTGGSKVGVLGSESDLLEGVESEGREETDKKATADLERPVCQAGSWIFTGQVGGSG